MNKRMVGIFFCMLVIIPISSINVSAETELLIHPITGDWFMAGAYIKNIGDETVDDVEITISVVGGRFGFVDVFRKKIINSINPGDEVRITACPVIGTGPINITVTASADGVDTVTASTTGHIRFFFVDSDWPFDPPLL